MSVVEKREGVTGVGFKPAFVSDEMKDTTPPSPEQQEEIIRELQRDIEGLLRELPNNPGHYEQQLYRLISESLAKGMPESFIRQVQEQLGIENWPSQLLDKSDSESIEYPAEYFKEKVTLLTAIRHIVLQTKNDNITLPPKFGRNRVTGVLPKNKFKHNNPQLELLPAIYISRYVETFLDLHAVTDSAILEACPVKIQDKELLKKWKDKIDEQGRDITVAAMEFLVNPNEVSLDQFAYIIRRTGKKLAKFYADNFPVAEVLKRGTRNIILKRITQNFLNKLVANRVISQEIYLQLAALVDREIIPEVGIEEVAEDAFDLAVALAGVATGQLDDLPDVIEAGVKTFVGLAKTREAKEALDKIINQVISDRAH